MSGSERTQLPATLSESAALYAVDFQPVYTDSAAKQAALAELRATTPVTTPKDVYALREELAAITTGDSSREVIIDAGCAEPVDAHVSIDNLVASSVMNLAVTHMVFHDPLDIQRNRGQGVKPRSSFVEKIKSCDPLDEAYVISFMGEGVNGRDINDREPDPTRMVAMALQARDLEAAMTKAMGCHIPAAHEALLLCYEEQFIHTDPLTGKRVLLSTDLPWIGERTRRLDGPHVALLADLENPVGVKLGPDATPEDVIGLKDRLNPNSEPGKLNLMLRMGANETKIREILETVRRHAPESLLEFDLHGSTKSVEGVKIRSVPDIIKHIRLLSTACGDLGLRLHGLHLETMTDQTRLECVDRADQLPTHPGNVDPQLNPAQKYRVLRETAAYLQKVRV